MRQTTDAKNNGKVTKSFSVDKKQSADIEHSWKHFYRVFAFLSSPADPAVVQLSHKLTHFFGRHGHVGYPFCTSTLQVGALSEPRQPSPSFIVDQSGLQKACALPHNGVLRTIFPRALRAIMRGLSAIGCFKFLVVNSTTNLTVFLPL